jgi:cell fate (sporulation/competence/biofilm development) regulator YlbF (YheA/YmcA/DUF963 family)
MGFKIDEREEVKRLYMQFGMTKLDIDLKEDSGSYFDSAIEVVHQKIE